jgi:hypothetical protein
MLSTVLSAECKVRMSVFDGKNPSYALEKIGDYLNRSGSGYLGFGEIGVRLIVQALNELRSKVEKHEVDFPGSIELLNRALWNAQCLEALFVRPGLIIGKRREARKMLKSLRSEVGELRKLERALDGTPSSTAK